MSSIIEMKRAVRALSILIGLILFALAAAVILSQRAFSRLVRRDVVALVERSQPRGAAVVTEDMLSKLPAPIQRYLRYTGVVGRPFVETVHLKQKGTMRPSPEGGWMRIDAEEFYTVQPPGFVWDGTLRAGPMPIGRARDMYRDGTGTMLIKLGALYTIADAIGKEMDQGSMMRYFNEMIWFPTAFLGDNVSFTPIDDRSARATFTDRGRSVSARLYFDDEGRLTNFVAERFRSVGDRYELTPWSTPVMEYGQVEGLQLPVRGKAVWSLPEGDLEYIDVRITELEYNTDGRHRVTCLNPAVGK